MRIKKELFGFGKSLEDLNIKDVLSHLPSLLPVAGKKIDMNWEMDKQGRPTITSSLSIPLREGKHGSWLQLITVLSLGLEKQLFSLKQRLLITLDGKEKVKQDQPLYVNEKFKSLKDLIDKIKDSLTSFSSNKLNGILKKLGITKESFDYIVEKEDEERTDVIVKVGNKWRIKGRKVKYWNAEYDTKADAQAALRAYWANKHECYNHIDSLKLEGFSSATGKELLRKVQSFLIKIFGHTLYFDHYTDNSVDLYYKGDEVAELLYDDKTEEVVIMPEDSDIAPVSFYDTSEYEIKDYLSDLILGDLNPSLA